MQNFLKRTTTKACLALLSLSMLGGAAFCYDGDKVSYLDSVSSSYLYNNQDASSIAESSNVNSIEATFRLDTRPVISSSSDRINLSLRDSDVKQVLRMLADKAGINIVLDDSVSGNLTLDLTDININDAFMVIFKALQLTYTMEANTMTVMTTDTFKSLGYTRQNMTVLPIKYVSADRVASFLNSNLFEQGIYGLTNKPIVTSNPSTNQIIIFGSSSDVMAIKRILPVLDTKPSINTFNVNHTTPKEMANLICDSLFYESGEEGSTKSEDNSENSDIEKIYLGGGIVACRDAVESESEDGLEAFKGNSFTVSYFPSLGQITTYGGSPEQIAMVSDFIKKHDKKQLMAYIEMSVIELNESGSKEFSNEWNLWTPFVSLGFSPDSGLTTSSTSPFFVWGNKYPTNSNTITRTKNEDGTTTTTYGSGIQYVTRTNNKALTYTLKYLVENGNGRVLTNPKIMVTNGQKSTIDMTSDYVKSVTSQILQGSDSVTSGIQKTYDIGSDEGLLIEIVPFISPDGYVSMNISPEFATVKERLYSIGNAGTEELSATLLQRRDLDLRNIRIRDGETLVIAGLIKESESQTVKKMPILSDLPLVGALFRGNSNQKSREELVIVVTPHIVKDSDDPNTYNL